MVAPEVGVSACSRARGVENTNVIYLRYKGRETDFPPAETTFELVHCLLPSTGLLEKEEV